MKGNIGGSYKFGQIVQDQGAECLKGQLHHF